MTKRIRKNKSFKRKSTIYKRKNKRCKRKTYKNKKGGTNYDIVKCCMCEKDVNINDTLIPQICMQINGANAHRICSQCWWDPISGFAREGAPHGCPGCIKKLPLTKSQTEVIDLSDD
jgi:hypothetical protein